MTLTPYAYVYGGFAGSETEHNQRDWVANVTVLDAQHAGSVVTALAGQGVSALDGFTVTNGEAQSGGGLYVFNSSPMIANNTIMVNSASGTYGCGGGLYLLRSAATISNNTITSNTADNYLGGGLYVSYSATNITNNTITDNSTYFGGGGLHVRNSSPTITDNMIIGNSAYYRGGGLELYYAAPTIVRNTITDNAATGTTATGGGLYLRNSSPVIAESTISGNSADRGGGLYLFNYSAPQITNSTIAGNSAHYAGGGLHLRESSPTIAQNTITGNSAGNEGGGLYLQSDSSPAITGNTIAGNVAGSGGGLSLSSSSPVIANNTITDNAATGATASGGGLYVWNSAATIEGNTIANNTATGSNYGMGGGLYVYSSSATIAQNAITGNEAQKCGGGLHLVESSPTIANNAITGNSVLRNGDFTGGGGLSLFSSSPTIVNNTVAGNTARPYGGGLWLHCSSPAIVNNLVAGNNASHGGGLLLSESSATVVSSTITGNRASHTGGGLSLQFSSATIVNTIVAFNSSGVFVEYDGESVLWHNCVYGNTAYDYSGLDDPTGTDGNISEDPLFVLTPGPGPDGAWGTEDDELGDLRLSAGSPGIDAGDNAYVPEFVTTDLDGNPRFVDDMATPDTGTGDWPIVDMGAYEYQFRPADLNCDGLVNTFDIDPFVLALTSAFDEPPFAGYLAVYPGCNPLQADINGDGAVNVFDIDPFVQCLTGGGCPTGACCLAGGCQELTQAACMGASWSQWLEGETCEPYPCPAPAGMTLIPAGEFMMGDTFGEGEADGRELPVHAVYVDAFYIGVYEVTNAEYAAGLNWAWAQGGLISVSDGVVYQAGSGTSFPYCCTTAAPPGWPEGGNNSTITWDGAAFGVVEGKENHPVVSVSWFGATAYCNWHSAREGRPVAYDLSTWTCDFGAPGYRLPTEAEWERAARGGMAGSRFAWPDQDTIEHARASYQSTGEHLYDTSPTSGYHPLWDDGSEVLTSPVGFFTGELQEQADWGWPGPAASYQTGSGVNAYGLHDMTGNVWEWCHDWFDPTYYSSSPYGNPTGPASGMWRVLRGGSWYSVASSCRVARRSRYSPNVLLFNHGLRIALNYP